LAGGAELINMPDAKVQDLTATQTNYDAIPDYIDLAWSAALRMTEGSANARPPQ
jgi:hypothetical protein